MVIFVEKSSSKPILSTSKYKILPHPQQLWYVKLNYQVNISCTCLRVSFRDDLNFHNVFSRNMTGEKRYQTNIKPYSQNYVIFGDIAKGKINCKGQLDYPDLLCLNGVLLVDGLATNLISIRQSY